MSMNGRQPAAPVLGGGGLLRVRVHLSYDGGPFNGWAVQPGLRTVQGILEEALALLIRRPIRVTVAGRTDAGVHARGQGVHLDLTEAAWLTRPPGHEMCPGGPFPRGIRGPPRRG